jgi:hypothetical protein
MLEINAFQKRPWDRSTGSSLECVITLQNCSQALGPISKPIQPSGILLLGRYEVIAIGSEFVSNHRI